LIAEYKAGAVAPAWAGVSGSASSAHDPTVSVLADAYHRRADSYYVRDSEATNDVVIQECRGSAGARRRCG
jgi:hypothetical protein